MSNRTGYLLAAVLIGLALGKPASAALPGLQILYHEEVTLAEQEASGHTRRISFDAYGRRFDLILERNESLLQSLPQRGARFEVLSGVIEGLPGSWARLTRQGDRWIGALFDGQELYAIEPGTDVASSAVQPFSKISAAPVVFRLSDALLPLGPGFCGTARAETSTDERPTAMRAYQAITSELRTQEWSTAPSKLLRVGVVADYEFASKFSFPEEQIVARMNIVDGIFSSQLGVKIVLAPPTIYTHDNDPFTRSKADDLLEELWRFRRESPAQRALGVTHLMTGRNLDGETVGIAYVGALCNHAAASLSEGARSTTTAALIVAHELGHNFNAPHDGEPGACEHTPQTYLMAPKLNYSNQFSACSIQQMRPQIEGAQCLTSYLPPDVRIETFASETAATVDTPFVLSFTVSALGSEPSGQVSATAVLPAELRLDSATAANGTCTSGDGTVHCDLGTLEPGTARTVHLDLMAVTTGRHEIELSVTSGNDADPDNNSARITVTATDTPPEPAEQTSGGKGGGGHVGIPLVLLLAGRLLAAHRRRAIAAEPGAFPARPA